MHLTLTGHHLEITPALRDYITSKLERLQRHFDHVLDVSVILSVEKQSQRIEATVHLKGKEIFVETRHDDMYAAVDSLIDTLDRQVIRYKEKRMEPRHNDAPKRSVEH